MKIEVYGADKVTTTKWRQSQLHHNRAGEVATNLSDADQQRAKEQLERIICQVTPVKH